jgi:P4 family phage/plasmid primase-like protien
MKFVGYYIYAIRGRWMDRYKIGYYIADLRDLKIRYGTSYGTDLEIIIFEISCNKKKTREIEKEIHETLSKWNCGSGELFYLDCLSRYLEIGCMLSNDNVTIPLKNRIKSPKKKYPVIDDIDINSSPSNNCIKRSDNIRNIYRERYTDIFNITNTGINKDLLPCKNCIIDLRTGNVMNSDTSTHTGIKTIYKGINHETPEIDKFISSIFHDDTEVIDYVQKLLGYAITGNNNEQCLAIFEGRGSNGKTLLISMIEELMGEFFMVAPPQVFFKNTKNRKIDENTPTPHLGVLKHKRICVREETDDDTELNFETLKIISGGSTITSRGAYEKHYISFTPKLIPILLCNKKPKIDVDDISKIRRILVVPFKSIYTTLDDPRIPYDKYNPYHKFRDNNMKDKLTTHENSEQLLTWLVQGSVKWYKSGLGVQPQQMVNAFDEYYAENDTLSNFINESCEIMPEYYVNAGEFRKEYMSVQNVRIKQKDLEKKMVKRGFHPGRPKVGTKQVKSYIGLKLKLSEE